MEFDIVERRWSLTLLTDVPSQPGVDGVRLDLTYSWSMEFDIVELGNIDGRR